jgi:tetratricopeptide (TPR) repeat protein
MDKKRKRNFFRIAALVLGMGFITGTGYGKSTNYTYNYDLWGDQANSPDPYRVSSYLLGTTLGVGNFRDPQGLFVKNNLIYICDSGNNRIVVIEVKGGGSFEVVKIAASVMIDDTETTFNYPTDIFVRDNGDMYIADMNNQRILRLDSEWNYQSVVLKPVDETIDPVADFLPNKLVVDPAGRIFVKALNVNKGLMEFDPLGGFTGYMGANKVLVNPIDYFWKLISTRAQRSRMDLFIPTEYSNICLDHEGFVYAVNINTFTQDGLMDALRRLNSMGQDILIRNDRVDPQGDWHFSSAAGIEGPSRFVDVAPFDNDSYACLDQTRGRIFVYDFQGKMLYTFGGVGNREGYFLMPVAIANRDSSLFVLDSRTAALTCFEFTAYGALINDALNDYKAGRYEASAKVWEQVLKMNGNYEMAYIGIGRAAFRQGDYRKAMEYYKIKYEKDGYGRAFQFYRKQWMEENLWKILLVLGLIIIVHPLVKTITKLVREIQAA